MSVQTLPPSSPAEISPDSPELRALFDARARAIDAMGRAICKAREYAPGTLPHETYTDRARKHERASMELRRRILAAAGIEDPAEGAPHAERPADAGELDMPADLASPVGPVPAPAPITEAPARKPAKALAALDEAGLWIAQDVTSEPARIDGPAPDPATHAGTLLRLARELGIVQLWIHPRWATAAGMPPRWDITAPHPFVTGAEADGWDMGEDGLAPWFHAFQRGIYGAVDLALPHMETRAPWRQAADARELLDGVTAYAAALGYGYRRSPGSTATGLLRKLHSGANALSLDASAWPPEPAEMKPEPLHDFAWIRLLTAGERAQGYVHAFDRNAMYLAACNELVCGFGEAEHIEAPAGGFIPFDASLPGYWLASIEGGRDPLLPDPFYPGGRRPAGADPAALRWYLTPTLVLAGELGARVTIREAYVWREHHRPFEPWYKRLRDARAGLIAQANASAHPAPATLALAAVKNTYTKGIGWLDGEWGRRRRAEGGAPEDLYRPDWRHLIMAKAEANAYRMLAKIAAGGRYPFAADYDCFYFTSDAAEARADVPAPITLGAVSLRDFKVKVDGVPLAHVAPILADLEAGRGRNHQGRLVSALRIAQREREKGGQA